MFKLTYEEERWLSTHGGRDWNDVQEDSKGYFVLMFNPRGFINEEKIYFRIKDKI